LPSLVFVELFNYQIVTYVEALNETVISGHLETN